jgi:hypothetical protein
MRTTKEAQLNSALLHYVAKCLDEGDFEALTRLGLDRSDAEATESPPIFAGRISTYFKGLGTDQTNSTPSVI